MRQLVLLGLILSLTATPTLAAQEFSGGKSPSPVLVQMTLEGIIRILENHDAGTKIDLLPILTLTTKTLGLHLKEEELQLAQKDWAKFLQDQGDTLRLDSADRQARRILIWELQWLYRQGLKNP